MASVEAMVIIDDGTVVPKNMVMRWIPVSRELPTPNKRVLVCLADGNMEMDHVGMYSKCFVAYSGLVKSGVELAEPVAWMPLPEPYRPIEEDVW